MKVKLLTALLYFSTIESSIATEFADSIINGEGPVNTFVSTLTETPHMAQGEGVAPVPFGYRIYFIDLEEYGLLPSNELHLVMQEPFSGKYIGLVEGFISLTHSPSDKAVFKGSFERGRNGEVIMSDIFIKTIDDLKSYSKEEFKPVFERIVPMRSDNDSHTYRPYSLTLEDNSATRPGKLVLSDSVLVAGLYSTDNNEGIPAYINKKSDQYPRANHTIPHLEFYHKFSLLPYSDENSTQEDKFAFQWSISDNVWEGEYNSCYLNVGSRKFVSCAADAADAHNQPVIDSYYYFEPAGVREGDARGNANLNKMLFRSLSNDKYVGYHKKYNPYRLAVNDSRATADYFSLFGTRAASDSATYRYIQRLDKPFN